MIYVTEEISRLIIEECLKYKSCDPVEIFNDIARMDFMPMHGPEHHVLDGACILTAFHNAGGNIDLEQSLEKLMKEGLRMPGAMIALKNAVEYINAHYDVRLDYEEQTCEFSYKNEQCIRDRCPFFSKNKCSRTDHWYTCSQAAPDSRKQPGCCYY